MAVITQLTKVYAAQLEILNCIENSPNSTNLLTSPRRTTLWKNEHLLKSEKFRSWSACTECPALSQWILFFSDTLGPILVEHVLSTVFNQNVENAGVALSRKPMKKNEFFEKLNEQ